MRLNKIKLKWQIFGYILGFAAIIILVFCIFQIFMLESMYKDTKINNIEKLLNEVEKDVISIDDFNDKEVNNNFLKLATEEETAIYLFGLDGTEYLIINKGDYYKDFSNEDLFKEIIAKSDSLKIGKFYITFDNNIPAPINMEYPALTKEPIDSVDSAIICAKFVKIKNVEYLLVLDARLAPVNPAVSTLKNQLVYISIIVVIVSVFVAIGVGYLISKPIKKINDSAKLLASGKRDIVFDGKGYLEIEDLNSTLNYAVEELKKTEKLQKELLANISHDLKTPITLISGYAEMMKDIKEENTPENLELIIAECNRLNLLVNDLLELSRLQSKTTTFNNTKFNITKLIKEIVERQVLLSDFNIEFNFDKEYYVYADEKRISQVIYNFITNAINYSKDDKHIIITQNVKNNCLSISVKDFGIGISDDELHLIWNRYYRVDKTHQRNSVGTGLGLSIVKEILDHYGFKYYVDSIKDEGSTFTFEIQDFDEV
ncbi:MAG: HAMP domain-containing histidine kinase [Bacilli bacterium]|nr:HAMP domain-containing histidine kinase [Bacilli bacterium]